MRIGTFGDLHGADPSNIIEYFNGERVDLILANGDFISCKNKNLEAILEKIVSNVNAQVVVIPGNYENPTDWRFVIKRLKEEYDNIIDNHRKKYEFKGYSIISYGGGTIRPTCINEIFLINPTLDVSELATKIDNRTILQLHEPPKYYGDNACAYIAFGMILPLPCNHPKAKKIHAGNEWLTYLIEGELGTPKPRLVVAGHIHEGKTSLEIGTRKETDEGYNLFVNPGAAKDGHHAIIEINDSSTRVYKSF